jgi:hypothetical protein
MEHPAKNEIAVSKHFTIFFHSRRSTKLNVEFIETSVPDHILNNSTCLSQKGLFESKAKYIIHEHRQLWKRADEKQATTKEHVEMFLKFNLPLFPC